MNLFLRFLVEIVGKNYLGTEETPKGNFPMVFESNLLRRVTTEGPEPIMPVNIQISV
jgi:hypothetical protein